MRLGSIVVVTWGKLILSFGNDQITISYRNVLLKHSVFPAVTYLLSQNTLTVTKVCFTT